MSETLDLDPKRWQRAQELFHTALDVPADERTTWLDQACGEDRRLHAAVAALLDAADGATDRVDRVVDSAATTLAGHPERIDAYRILDLLGRGGMGAVYLAERDDEHYRQQVAIKVVRHGLGHPELLARLRQERQILAHLKHPHIARLLDGGNTADGSPYVVMEHIDGEPIDAWCDRHRLDTEGRVELLVKVCDAVQHAHRNLVIHRDLKPSNLLVDSDGEPKLLDFGIAKLLDPALAGPSSAETAPGVLHLTPEYASPEQFGDLPLTTGTDTYSLGVVLYELLTGRRPHVVHRARLPFAVCGVEPPLASEAIDTLEDPERVAADRGTSVDALRRRLTGDLDTILAKALRKEPERRYASVEQLGDDLRRHLAGLPVLARPATFGYRAGKFFARHRAATLATVVGLVIAVALTGFYTDQLAKEQERVLAEASRRATLYEFLIRLFSAAHPDKARGDEVTLSDFLDQSASQLEAELAEPELRSEIHDALGDSYLNLGLHDSARHHFDSAFAERSARLASDHPDVAISHKHLGDLAFQEGDLTSAEQHFGRALAIRRHQFGERSLEAAESLHDLGATRHDQGRLEEAVTLLEQALAIREEHLVEDDPRLAETLNSLGSTLNTFGRSAEGELLVRRAVAILERRFGDVHGSTINSFNNLAMIVAAQGKFDEAIELQRQAITRDDLRLPEDHVRHIEHRQNLAAFLKDQKAFDQARPVLLDALERQHRLFGPDHRNEISLVALLGDLERDAGRPEQAIEHYLEALDLARRLDPAPMLQVNLLFNAGRAAVKAGRPDQAEPLVTEGLDLFDATGEPENAWTDWARRWLAER